MQLILFLSLAKRRAMNDSARLPFGRILGYGIGDFGFNFYWLPLQLFLAYYYTDVLGLSSRTAGLIIFACLTWDGLIDPIIGILANRTRTRWGKYRPYLFLGAVPLAASFALMFAPVSFEGTALVAYAFATQILFRTLYGAVNIPYGALMAQMTRSSLERNWLAGTRMACAFAGGAVVSYLTPRLVAYFAATDRATAYLYATALLSAAATLLVFVTVAATAERTAVRTEESWPTTRQLLKMLGSNVPFLQIMAGIGFYSFANILINSGLVYYVKYNLGYDEAVAGQVASIMQVTQAASIIPWTIASRYIGKRAAWLVGLTIAAIGPVGLYLSESPDLSSVYLLLGLYAAGSGATAVNFWSIVPDTVEYGELRTGIRAEAFIFGFVTLVQKAALGVSSAFLGAYLGWIGYVANQPQSADTLAGLKLLVTLIATCGLIASWIVMYFYRLDAARHAQIVQEIAAREAARS
jgi:glycoside/pentoside/hexuronide:cation symporter, GPH family